MNIFSLSSNALKTLNFNLYEKDFKFIVEDKEYYVSKIFADFVSPNVNKLHRTDPTSNCYFIPKYDKSKQIDYFKNLNLESISDDTDNDIFKCILQLSEGNEIEINKFNKNQLLYYFNKLGNSEFLNFLLDSAKFQEINEYNAIDRLILKLSNSISAKDELAYISSNLYEFDEDVLSSIDSETLGLILSQPSLRIQNEEWLFDFIMKNISKNPSFVSLFEYVEFCNLSVDKIFQFEETITLDELNYMIWRSICKRLMCEIVSSYSGREKKSSQKYISPNLTKLTKKAFILDDSINSNSNKQYNGLINHDGIISYLFNKNNRNNPAKGENKLIEITSSSCELSHSLQNSTATNETEESNLATLSASASISSISDSDSISETLFSDTEQNESKQNSINALSCQLFEPENVTEFESDSRFYSKDEPNQYIMFDFKDYRINPTHYMIRTQGCGANCCHMKNWVCEVSEDGNEWIEGDKQENSSDLNGSFLVGIFSIKTEAPLKYRFIRIRQTGLNWFNDNRMIMCGIEFFGTLYE